ncbi:MAG TPA: Plug domain-containing protein [Longimicrobiaceae bacterium]|nr:Plug domain-containing protein [Longimicrobiaceae bacterium]
MRSTTRSPSSPFALLLGGFLAACTLAPLSTPADGPVAGGRVVTAEQIRESGARTAWQALERQPGLLRTGTAGGGRVTARGSRAVPGTLAAREPLLVLDGARMADMGILRDVPAESVQSIRVLGAIEGTALHGAAGGNGVVEVRTGPPAHH